MAEGPLVKFSSGDCTEAHWWINISSGNGLVSPDNKPLPEPMLTKFYDTVYCQWATMCWGACTCSPVSTEANPWETAVDLVKERILFQLLNNWAFFLKCELKSNIDGLVLNMLNSLWPCDTIWRQRSGSTLAQVMAFCLMAPSHYLNQCWLIISKVQWHLSKDTFTTDSSAINHLN